MVLNRKLIPETQDPVAFDYKLQPINQYNLDNGIELYWLNAGVQNVVEINWIFPAGLWYEGKNAVASATAGLLKNGTHTHTAQQLNEALEFYGASLKTNATNDHASVTLHALSKHLPLLLPIVQDVLCNATFPEAELALHKQNAIQRLLVNLRECEFVANQQIDAALFGTMHPYGRFSEKEKIEAITQEDLINFYKKNYNLSGVKIFMAGKVSEQDVPLVNKIFGKEICNPISSVEQSFPLPEQNAAKKRISNDVNGVQGAIRIGRRFIKRTHPDFAAMVVLNTILGGYFGSRLMSNIREEKGFTYGIYSSMSAFTHDASLIIHTEVGSHVIDDAVKEIYIELERLRNELVSDEELLLVKNYLLGNILGDLDGPFSIMQRWRSLILNGFTENRFNENINVYKNISPAELQVLAQKYFDKNDFTEIVVV
jgi:zinc protease